MSKMVNTQPKGLFTSLVLFITLGLFSLATLFTVLILEVRSGQQQLNQQLKTLTGVPLPTPQVIAENNLSPLPGDQFNRLLATVDLIATRQRSSNVNVLLQQLEQIDSKMELIQQSVSHNKTPTEVPQLSKIEQAITAQQLQLEGLLQGQQQQATQNQAIDKKLQQVSYPAPLPAPIDLSTVENQLEHLQQQVTQLAERPDTSRAIQQQLKQLVKQQRGLKQSQQQLQESVMQIALPPAPSEMPSSLPSLKPLQEQLKQIDQRQQSLEKMVKTLTQEQNRFTSHTTPALSPQQLEAVNTHLQQLTQQQHQMERNLLKSMEQSNTIKPYSYNAR